VHGARPPQSGHVVPAARAAHPAGRPPHPRPEPSVHRAGEVYGSAQVAADDRHDPEGLHRSGDIYDSGDDHRSGDIYQSADIHSSGDIYQSGDDHLSGDIYQSGDIHRSGEIYGAGASGGGVYGTPGGGEQGGKRRADVTAIDLGYTGRRSKPEPVDPTAAAAEPDGGDETYYGNGNYWEAGGFTDLDEGYPGWTEAEERHGKNW
jgi:hypothetical protein